MLKQMRWSAVAMVALTAAAAPAVAPAATVDTAQDEESRVVTFEAAPTEANRLTVTQSGNTFTFKEAGAATMESGDSNCVVSDAGKTVTCTFPESFVVTDLTVSLGDEDDTATLEGVAVFRFVSGDAGGDTLTGSDFVGSGETGIEPGAGPENLHGGEGADKLFGRAGDDYLRGDAGDDEIDGGAGADFISDEAFCAENPCASPLGGGNDVLRGGDGDDLLFSDLGTDRYEGGDGSDVIQDSRLCTTQSQQGDCTARAAFTADTIDGGPGIDVVTYSDRVEGVDVSLARTTNQGEANEGDVITGVEDLRGGSGNDTLTGDARFNTLVGGPGNDAITGGAGGDYLVGDVQFSNLAGDDTIDAKDDMADRVICGFGTDSVNADDVDQLERCENVVTSVANPDDFAPTVAFTAPASGAKIPAAGTVLRATAADARGAIVSVLFVDDAKVICTDTTAPYECAYKPTGEDVGRNTLAAVAVDTANQTATAFLAVEVGRFAPRSLTASTKRSGSTFRTKGRVNLPASVTRKRGCGEGLVAVQVKNGSKTISTRRVKLSRTCTFRSSVVFRDSRRTGPKLKFSVRFLGNDVLTRSKVRVQKVSSG